MHNAISQYTLIWKKKGKENSWSLILILNVTGQKFVKNIEKKVNITGLTPSQDQLFIHASAQC